MRAVNGLATRSEAVYLDAVSADGSTGFVVRLCRFPQAGVAWLWAHVFEGGRCWSFTDHEAGCDEAFTDLDTRSVVYRSISSDRPARLADTAPTPTLTLERDGPLAAPLAARARARVAARSGFDSRHGAGDQPLEIDARFEPGSAPVSNRMGRHEILGMTRARIRIGEREIVLEGRGHFHEQVQTDARFGVAFTYASLRGADSGLIFLRGARGARGQYIEGGSSIAIVKVELSAPNTWRSIAVHLADGRVLRGDVEATYRYTIPVFDEYRPGSVVRARLGGVVFSGCMNDFRLEQLDFDLPRPSSAPPLLQDGNS